ncbi:MAG: class I SAM-dependent methyltransferase, partial [Candidatus Heimdallarchaeaceae archaeon]
KIIESEDEGDWNRRLVIDPALWKLIGEVDNLSVLDAGCGNGYLSRQLAKKGAQVTGVDHSKYFIKFCNQKEEETQLGCQFVQSSLADLSSFESKSFDLVVSNIVFIDVLEYKKAFKEISRILKKDGRFIWSNTHPVFGRTGVVDPKLPFDSKRNEERLFKIVDRYFDSGGILMSWGDLEPVWQISRTLTEYSKALKDAGFVISEIVEPKPTIEQIQKHPKFLAFDADRFSQFIIYECKLVD